MEELTSIEEAKGPLQAEPDGDLCDSADGVRSFQEERQRRVEEYHAGVLAKSDPLQAVLGSINAGLMQIGIQLDQQIRENLIAGPATLERIMRHAAAIELHLKLARQIDRFAQLEIRPRSKVEAGEESPPKRPR